MPKRTVAKDDSIESHDDEAAEEAVEETEPSTALGVEGHYLANHRTVSETE